MFSFVMACILSCQDLKMVSHVRDKETTKTRENLRGASNNYVVRTHLSGKNIVEFWSPSMIHHNIYHLKHGYFGVCN